MITRRVLVLLVVCTLPAFSQRYAGLYGRILDTFEGGIGQAAVTVVNEETGFRHATQSEPGGGYSIQVLLPGIYKITVRKDGFRSMVRFGVTVAAASATRADFVLPVGSIEESITVYGTAPLLEQEDGSAGRRMDRDEFERLPLNGRGVLTLLEFAPGTNVTPATRGEAGQFSASGQRPNTNYFTVDGASANAGVAAGGLPAQSTGGALPALSAFGSMDSVISLEAVEELHVTTSTGVAELGRMPGALVAIHSRSGTNALHGSTLYRFRDDLFNANDWFANEAGYGRIPLRLHDVTLTLGGPVKKNRTFFFLSYQHIALRQPYDLAAGGAVGGRPRGGGGLGGARAGAVSDAESRRTGGGDRGVGGAQRPSRGARHRRPAPGPFAHSARQPLCALQRLAVAQPVRHPGGEPAAAAVAQPDGGDQRTFRCGRHSGCAGQRIASRSGLGVEP